LRCEFNSNKAFAKVIDYVKVAKDERSIKNAIATHGVVSVMFDANDQGFYLYKGGIYTDYHGCSQTKVSHATTLVGYGSNYYIMRNQWDTTYIYFCFFINYSKY